MTGMIIADDDIAGVAAGADFFHQRSDPGGVVFFYGIHQRRDKGDFTRLHLGAGAEIAVQLRIQLVIGVGADAAQQQAGEGHQAQKQLDLK
ncbi:Uncharacterised protein [Acinetobacter baumannii]|nr:Uncharacterised protein [Acinetobacter baumannii]